MSVKMKFGSKDIPFVYKGDKLVYPNPIKDGLLLWYDFKGMRNTDTNKEVAKDLSGNGNDGTLTNFNFTEESGYKDNTLVFDGVDDSLTIPELVLDETAMTVVQGGEIYSYEDDKVIKVKKYSEDGSVELDGLEVGGRNLLLNSTKYHNHKDSRQFETVDFGGKKWLKYGYSWNFSFEVDLEKGQTYTFSIVAHNPDELSPSRARIYVGHRSNILFKDVQPNETTLLSQTFTATEDESQALVRILVNGNNFPELFWGYPKLEKFNVISDWTPAPEDFQTTALSSPPLSNLQLYNRPLRKDELLHNAESKGLKELVDGVVVQDGLMLHYDFSHESNTSEYKDKAFDYSGNGNHGELQNFNFTEESGYEGEGLKFDGVDDVVESNNKIDGIYCLEATFTLDVEVDYLTILSSLNHIAGGQGFAITTVSRRNFRINRKMTPDNLGVTSFPLRENIKIGNTYHIVAQYKHLKDDDYMLELYLNGEKYGEEKVTGFVNSGSTLKNPVMVGKYSPPYNGYYYKKPIYSARAYNRALSPEEIQHNYQIDKEKFNITEGDA